MMMILARFSLLTFQFYIGKNGSIFQPPTQQQTLSLSSKRFENTKRLWDDEEERDLFLDAAFSLYGSILLFTEILSLSLSLSFFE